MHLFISARHRLFPFGLRGAFMIALWVALQSAASVSATDTQAPAEIKDEHALSSYTVGVFLLESGRPQKAIPHLESAWASSGQNQTIGNKLSEAYFRAGDLHGCNRILDILLTENNENENALLLKARIKYFRGEDEEALTHLRRLRSFAVPSFEVERLIGRIELELGRYEEALAAYGKATRLDPNYPTVQYRYGLLLRKFDRDVEAEQAFRKAIRLQPLFSEAVVELAEMLIGQDRREEAERLLLRLLDQDGEFFEALMLMANLYADNDKKDDAIQLLEQYAHQGNLRREGVLLLGRLYYEVDDFAGALGLFRELFDRDDKTPELARVLGELSLRTSQPDTALMYYEQAIGLEPDDYRNYLALFFAASSRFRLEGVAVIELTDEQKTTLLEQAADRVSADDFNAAYVLGISFQSVDQLRHAKKFFARALELQPDDDRILLNLASVMERMGDYREAEPLLVKLHAMRPNDPTVCNFYGYLLALMNSKLDQAEQLIRTALKHEPNNGYYMDSLGWVFYKKGEYAKAVVELERASRLVEDDPVILEHLGDAYRSLQRFQEAVAAYEKSLGLQGENATILDKIHATRNQIGN